MTNTAVRSSGLIMLLGAMLLGVAIVMTSLNPFGNQSTSSPLISLLLLLSSILLLLSFPSMYAKQSNAAGWLGIVGHALLQIGMLLIVVVAAMPLRYLGFNLPSSGENGVDFVFGISLTLGLLFTAIATIRAHVFPRWAGILLLAATAGFFFDFFVAEFLPSIVGQLGVALFGILLALGLAWVGVAMMRGLPESSNRQ